MRPPGQGQGEAVERSRESEGEDGHVGRIRVAGKTMVFNDTQ